VGKQTDGVNYDHEEGMAFRSSLATDVRSMLADFSQARRDQAEKARSERKAFLHAIKNKVSDLNAETRRITSGSSVHAAAIELRFPEPAVLNASPVPESPAENLYPVEVEEPVSQTQTPSPSMDASFQAPQVEEALPEPIVAEIAVVDVAEIAEIAEIAEAPAPVIETIVARVAEVVTPVLQTKPEETGESDWLRETILGPKPRKNASKQKRPKK
jgi:hypothetical protein